MSLPQQQTDGIRRLVPDDVAEAAALFHAVMHGGPRIPHPATARLFRHTLLDHPWADPELPSLVYTEAGRIVGFIGSLARRLRFDDRPLRAAYCAHLVADPEARNRAVGALLLSRFMSGPQDVTLSDTATADVRRMWDAFGGDTLQAQSHVWLRPFRPWDTGRALAGRARPGGWLDRSPTAARISGALDRISAPAAARLRAPASDLADELLTPQLVLDELPRIAASTRLRPDYDAAYLEWLFSSLGFWPGRGIPVRRVVRRNQRVLGWFVYYRKPGGISRTLQIVARPRDIGPVFRALLADAAEGGSAALSGRVEPALLETLAEHRCATRLGPRMLVHTQDAELRASLQSGRALVSLLDGECW